MTTTSTTNSFTSVLGLVAAFGVGLILLVVVGVFVIVVVANRADPDQTGRRPFGVYFFAVAFIAVWATLVGSTIIVASLVQLIGTTHGSGSSIHPVGDAAARAVVVGVLITLLGGAAFLAHIRRGVAIATSDDQPASPIRRVQHSYAAAVAFISVLILLVAVGILIYQLLEIIGPGLFGQGNRIPPLRGLIDAAYVSAAAGALLIGHLRLAPPALRARSWLRADQAS